MVESIANSIVAQALQNVGVRPTDINVPSEPSIVTPPSKDKQGQRPNLDGTLKGQTKGEALEDREPEDTEPKLETPGSPELGAVEPAEQKPLTTAEVNALLDQASSKFQSAMDRKIYQLQVQTQSIVAALNQMFEAQENTSLSGLPENEQIQKRLERLESGPKAPKIPIVQPAEQQQVTYYQQMVNFVDTVGLRVDDKRIDWAGDTSDPKIGYSRFLASIKTAITEDQTNVIKALKGDGDKAIAKIRKQTGVDKVSTAGPSGKGLPNIDTMTPLQKIQYAFDQAAVLAQQNQ